MGLGDALTNFHGNGIAENPCDGPCDANDITQP